MPIDPEVLAAKIVETIHIALEPIERKLTTLTAKLESVETTTRALDKAQREDHDKIVELRTEYDHRPEREWLNLPPERTPR
jgi:hypothetical protein